jgi:metal-responsive CopG/Arc/MetJ family transcriptional regulator
MTLDEDLISKVDRTVKKLGTTRSSFARDALKDALKHLKEREKERKHREGYKSKPVACGEFNDWENEQSWID